MDTNKICPIYTDQVETFCSHCIVTDYTEIPYLLSIVGFQISVKAVIASFIQHSSTCIVAGYNKIPYHLAKGSFPYTIKSKKLPSGLFQAVVLPKSIIEQQYDETIHSSVFFVRMTSGITENDIAERFLAHYTKYTNIPLHKDWALPIWKCLNEDDYEFIDPLETLVGDINGYIVYHHDNELIKIITENLQLESPTFIDCFNENIQME